MCTYAQKQVCMYVCMYVCMKVCMLFMCVLTAILPALFLTLIMESQGEYMFHVKLSSKALVMGLNTIQGRAALTTYKLDWLDY